MTAIDIVMVWNHEMCCYVTLFFMPALCLWPIIRLFYLPSLHLTYFTITEAEQKSELLLIGSKCSNCGLLTGMTFYGRIQQSHKLLV